MKYALTRQDGVTEIREDSYPLQEGAFALTDAQYDQLISGQSICQVTHTKDVIAVYELSVAQSKKSVA